ncbi:MAG TPA: PIN domain-containing protein [Opitutaceae bacterium]|nr:PIN domain-containing protein [Opitutaceae bacterium]
MKKRGYGLSPILFSSRYGRRIDRLRADADPFLELAAASELWEPVTCGMVMLEVLRGVRHAREFASYRETFAVMECVPATNRIWESATDLLRALQRRGVTIPPLDAIIAACARSIDAAVLTFDEHFRAIPKMLVLDSLA